jgi:formate/nitrite transporter FocA (FNT family)
VEQLDMLNWGSLWTQNLITVTLGNIVGGAILWGLSIASRTFAAASEG